MRNVDYNFRINCPSCVTICWFRPINAHSAVVAYKIISSHVTQPLY